MEKEVEEDGNIKETKNISEDKNGANHLQKNSKQPKINFNNQNFIFECLHVIFFYFQLSYPKIKLVVLETFSKKFTENYSLRINHTLFIY